jgi:integrase
LDADSQPDYLKPVVKTAYDTGWRVSSDLLTRKRSHLDLQAKMLRLDPGEAKCKEGRNFPLTPRLYEILSKVVARNEAFQRATGQIVPWLFHRRGKHIKRFDKAWKSACKRAGISDRILHDFRRTAVRNLERAGVTRSVAMQMVGHKTESIYRRYAITDHKMLREAADTLGKYQRDEELRVANQEQEITSLPEHK